MVNLTSVPGPASLHKTNFAPILCSDSRGSLMDTRQAPVSATLAPLQSFWVYTRSIVVDSQTKR
jgi:hypothetical protein